MYEMFLFPAPHSIPSVTIHTLSLTRFLMNNKKEMSMDELKDLLMDNEITNFDPVAEAYRVFDQHGEGALSGKHINVQSIIVYEYCLLNELF